MADARKKKRDSKIGEEMQAFATEPLRKWDGMIFALFIHSRVEFYRSYRRELKAARILAHYLDIQLGSKRMGEEIAKITKCLSYWDQVEKELYPDLARWRATIADMVENARKAMRKKDEHMVAACNAAEFFEDCYDLAGRSVPPAPPPGPAASGRAGSADESVRKSAHDSQENDDMPPGCVHAVVPRPIIGNTSKTTVSIIAADGSRLDESVRNLVSRTPVLDEDLCSPENRRRMRKRDTFAFIDGQEDDNCIDDQDTLPDPHAWQHKKLGDPVPGIDAPTQKRRRAVSPEKDRSSRKDLSSQGTAVPSPAAEEATVKTAGPENHTEQALQHPAKRRRGGSRKQAPA